MPRDAAKYELLAAAIAAGGTIKAAAESAGVSLSTAKRRLREGDFIDLVRRLRGELIDAAFGQLASQMSDGAKTLATLLEAESEAVRLGAAKALIELGTKMRDSAELESRIAALESEGGS